MRALSRAAQIFLRRSCILLFPHPTPTLQSGRRGSNPRHQAWKACALPAELLPHNQPCSPRGKWQKPNSNFRESRSNKWWGKDSNLRRLAPADLQSAPVGHLGTPPNKSPALQTPCKKRRRSWFKKIPISRLQNRRQQSNSKADGENRTRNRLITNQVLCQLSYVSGRLFARDSQDIKAPEVSQSVALTRLSRSPGPPFQP